MVRNMNIQHTFLEYVFTGATGLYLSIVSSVILDVPAPPTITPENIINILTQLTILSGTIFGFYVKYKELKKINKKDK